MKKLNIVVLSVFFTMLSVYAHSDSQLKCVGENGEELQISGKSNPRNNASAFVTFSGVSWEMGGWAWKNADESSWGLTSSLDTYRLGGNFPSKSKLMIVTEEFGCGRACEKQPKPVKTAKLVVSDEEIYFKCM